MNCKNVPKFARGNAVLHIEMKKNESEKTVAEKCKDKPFAIKPVR